MSYLTYCENGCTRNHGETQIPVTTEGKSLLCDHCETRLEKWLQAIPDTYALLPDFIEHGTVERNPDAKTTKAVEAPAPMRLDIIDLLDTRLGRRWNGTAPAQDRRGVLGTLQANCDRLIDERPLTAHLPDHVTGCCNLLHRHRLWLAEQPWITDLYDDIRTINRTLSDAIGDYRPKPVGHCHVIPEGADKPCGGPLHANSYGGVRCNRCGATWDATHLRQLGLAQAAENP